jgi:hypothetical protein
MLAKVAGAEPLPAKGVYVECRNDNLTGKVHTAELKLSASESKSYAGFQVIYDGKVIQKGLDYSEPGVMFQTQVKFGEVEGFLDIDANLIPYKVGFQTGYEVPVKNTRRVEFIYDPGYYEQFSLGSNGVFLRLQPQGSSYKIAYFSMTKMGGYLFPELKDASCEIHPLH